MAALCQRLLLPQTRPISAVATNDGADAAPPRFDGRALAAFADASSTVYCECPRHLVDLLLDLSSFERYSAACASRSPEDADLHRDLSPSRTQRLPLDRRPKILERASPDLSARRNVCVTLVTQDVGHRSDCRSSAVGSRREARLTLTGPVSAPWIPVRRMSERRAWCPQHACPLRDKTLIIFSADNGTARFGAERSIIHGRHINGQKGSMLEGGARVPLIASWKDTMPSGQVRDDLIDFSDFFATFADLAGTKLPDGVTFDSRSFAPALRGQKGTPRDWIFVQLGGRWYVREQGFKLTQNGDLFDMSDAPFVEKPVPTDIENDEANAARTRLRAVLDKLNRPRQRRR